jgi:tripartite-type tricarboxylate transporter receptor subunit TctC
MPATARDALPTALPRAGAPRLAAACSLVAASLLASAVGAAQPTDAAKRWPDRPVRLLVPYVPGGLPDTLARVVGQRLTETLGRPFLVDNRPGAGGVIGTELVARALPDGHTHLVADLGQTAITPAMTPKLPYDIERDFAPVSLLGTAPFFLAVHSSTGVQTLPELVAWAKARGGSASYGSSGVGSPHHLAMEILRRRVGMDLVHVPYKGSGQSTPALVSGEVPMLFTVLPSVAAHVKAGTVRLVAVASAQRTPQAPEVPTFAELGVKGFVLLPSVAMLAPAGTPRAIIERLAAEIGRAVRHPEAQQRLAALGIEPVGSTPEAYAVQLQADIALFRAAVQAAGIRAE